MPAVMRLRSWDWDVAAIAELTPSVSDRDVLARAHVEGRWLSTFDRDYGELVFRYRLTPPPVILLLRVPSYRPEEPAEWLESLYTQGTLSPGYFHLFDGRMVRRRTLPYG